MKPPYEEHNRPIRRVLRFLGFLLLPVGLIFMGIGLVDFFSAFGGDGTPTKFWCLFVGIPLVAAGIGCLQAGYIRAINKYVAGEGVPVMAKSARYVARELRPEFKDYVQDLQGVEGPGRVDPVERMKSLEKLKEKGLITESEYIAKREEIIQKL